jgi:hypothetical protein
LTAISDAKALAPAVGSAGAQPSIAWPRAIIGATPRSASAQALRASPTRASMPSSREPHSRWPSNS